MKGPQLYFILMVAVLGFVQESHSKRSSMHFKRKLDQMFNEAREETYAKNHNEVLKYEDDASDALESELMSERVKDKVFLKKFKSYIDNLLERYVKDKEDEESNNENELDTKDNEDTKVRYLDDNRLENDIGRHDNIYQHMKSDSQQEKIEEDNLPNEEIDEDNGDDSDYSLEKENNDSNDNNKDTSDEDDYWAERENFEDKVEDHKDKEFAVLDYLVDSNSAEEGEDKEETFNDTQEDHYMDSNDIPDDYFDNSDYEA